ncbi:hypothetical protein BpHYR1_047771 [Brachionus plicatilis]|uniref:Uncharacterized protein n=1 Tax=Brachionus plicatilis TaxID=10195 RepID=A0A3M7T8U3_BRAPC|nr:hypothetical protein BpHYR1_047771 [Brachionus plicatilis]
MNSFLKRKTFLIDLKTISEGVSFYRIYFGVLICGKVTNCKLGNASILLVKLIGLICRDEEFLVKELTFCQKSNDIC